MESHPRIGTEPYDVARIWWNLRLIEDDVKHAAFPPMVARPFFHWQSHKCRTQLGRSLVPEVPTVTDAESMNKLLFPGQLATNRLQLPLAHVAFLIAVIVFVLNSPAYGQEEETTTPLAGGGVD